MGIGGIGRLGICVLVRAPAVPVPKDLPEAGEYVPLREWGSHGLFGLRLMKGPRFVQGCLLRQRGEAGAPGVRSALGDGVYTWKEGTGDRSYGFCV